MRTGINLRKHQKAALSTQITTPAAPGAKGCVCVCVCLCVREYAFRYICACLPVCGCADFGVESWEVNTT